MTDIETLRWTAEEILPLRQAEWLTDAMDMLQHDFAHIGQPFPDLDILVMYPFGEVGISWLGSYMRWGPDYHRIYINPTVDGLEALDILVHELVHAAVHVTDPGHGAIFYLVAEAIGLDDTGPYAAAKEALLKRLREIYEILGNYPLLLDYEEV